MRILSVHNYYQHPGGEDLVFDSEARLLEDHGHSVNRYTVHNDSLRDGRPVHAAINTLWSSSAYRTLRQVIREQQTEIVHFHNTFPLLSPAAYYAAKAEGAAVVQTLHNYRMVCPSATLFREGQVCLDCVGKLIPWPSVTHGCYHDSRPTTAVVAGMLTLHRVLRTSMQVDAFIALTNHQRNRLSASLPLNRITVKPNFLGYDPGVGTGQGGYGLFLGRLSPEKGIETLLDAWRHPACSIPLKIVGDGPLRSRVLEACATNKSVQWLGWKSREESIALLGDANFLIVPSVWEEGFPLTVVEAFSRGTPVIASDLGSLAELITHQQTGLVFAPGDANALAEAVAWAGQNPQAMIEIRQAGRSQFEKRYTAKENYRQLINIYEKALGPNQLAGNYQAKSASPMSAT